MGLTLARLVLWLLLLGSVARADGVNKSSSGGMFWSTAKEEGDLLRKAEAEDSAVVTNDKDDFDGGFSSLDGMLQWAIAYYLNPKYHYKQNIGDDPDLIDAALQVFQKLDPNSQHIGDIGNEIIMFREAKRSFGDRTAIASRDTMAPADWWSIYGTGAPTLRGLAMKILAQTASSSACEQNWSTFALIHTKQRNRLASERLEKMVYCYYNMKLRVRDLEAEQERALEMEPLNLLDIDVEIGDEEEFPLFEWIRPSHLDEADGAPNPKIAEAARTLGIDVDRVMEEEVMSGSGDSFENAMRIDRVNSDSSGGGSDGGGGGGSSGGARTESARPLSPFTGEAEFTHSTQDLDHGSRRAGPGVGAIGKQYIRKKRGQGSRSQQDVKSLSTNFDFMSIGTEQSSYGSFPYGTDSSFDSQSHSYHEFYGQSSLFDFDPSAYNPPQQVPPPNFICCSTNPGANRNARRKSCWRWTISTYGNPTPCYSCSISLSCN